MKLSSRSRYGIHAMVDLAQKRGEGPIPLKAIAERQGIPEAYLEQLLSSLRKASLVSSARGVAGGYELSRDASHISIGEIISALEGKITVADCASDPACCDRAGKCAPRALWESLEKAIDKVLSETTLQDMTNPKYIDVAITNPEAGIEARHDASDESARCACGLNR